MTNTTVPLIRVFVHLAYGFGAKHWQARWNRGEIIGINDPLPYGYFWAREDGCLVEHSEDKAEGYLARWFRLVVRLVFGFDFVHAWRNRQGIADAEVVWTHTESQYLSVLLLLRAWQRGRRPKVIAQTVWLFDRWNKLPPPRRWLYAKLIEQADILTVHSPENLKLARRLFPKCRSAMVPFGIRAETVLPRGPRPAYRPIRVLSLGNDRHRDWPTLIAAVRNWDDCIARLVSRQVDRTLIRSAPNAEIVHPRTNDELMALYEWADIVVVPLKPNLHASGITVVQEATLCGLPVVCSNTGGLSAYFREGEVTFVAPLQPDALRQRIAALASDDDGRWDMVVRARKRMMSDRLSSRRFAQRHAELSRELLSASALGPDEPITADARAATPRSSSPALRIHSRVLRPGLAVALVLAAAIGPVSSPAAATAAQAAARGETLDTCGFRRTFTEDFNTLSVSPWGEDGTRWIAHTPWRGDFGDAAFADPQPGFPFRTRDGILEIEARKDQDGKWQSGLLASATPTTSGFSQRYGYFEMRAQLPAGPGVWPAFWLNANQPEGSKEPGVEIDVLEYYGQFTDGYHSVVHVWDKVDTAKSRHEDHITNVPPGSLTSDFHTYGVEVAKDWITFYLDRRETWRTPTPPEMQAPSMVLVNLALGSGWPIDKTPNPSVMKVDYIHVYERHITGEANPCPSPHTGTTTPQGKP